MCLDPIRQQVKVSCHPSWQFLPPPFFFFSLPFSGDFSVNPLPPPFPLASGGGLCISREEREENESFTLSGGILPGSFASSVDGIRLSFVLFYSFHLLSPFTSLRSARRLDQKTCLRNQMMQDNRLLWQCLNPRKPVFYFEV